ncbi:hypothetical protein ASG90_10160 [Nocardioides sp. Soil797]|nr:hypothetical protein ASG90_10160 [Nocardioides sp. Soil797]
MALFAALLLTVTGCSGNDESSEPRTPEQELEHRLEGLAGVDEATVATDEIDTESFFTTAEVKMESSASVDDVATAITQVEQAYADFDDDLHTYGGSVWLAESDGLALVETEVDAAVDAVQRARWVVGATGAVSDASIIVSSERVTVRPPEPTYESVATTAEELVGADGLDGATVLVRSNTPDSTDPRAGGWSLSAPAEALDDSLLRGWARLDTALADGPTPITVSLADEEEGATLYVHLDVPTLRTPTPSLARHRQQLWPTVRALLRFTDQEDVAELVVEASSSKSGTSRPFVDLRPGGGTSDTDGDPAWQRVALRELHR